MSPSPAVPHAAPRRAIDLVGVLILILPPLFWAGNFVVGRAARTDIPPMMLSAARWVVALACLLPFALPGMRRDWGRYWQFRWQILRAALVGVVAFGTLVYLGLRSTTAANGLLLNSFIPVLIVLFGALFYGQRLRLAQTLGLLLSCVGVVVIIGHGEWQTLAAMRFAAGDLIVFVAMICWAVYTLWLRDFPAELDRLGMMGIQIVIGLVVLVPLAAWEHVGGQHASWNVHSILSVFYVGIFPSVLAYLLYMRGIARFGAARAGIFIHLMPVYGAVLSVVFLGESLHLYHAAGMAAILLGLVCTTLAGRGRPGH